MVHFCVTDVASGVFFMHGCSDWKRCELKREDMRTSIDHTASVLLPNCTQSDHKANQLNWTMTSMFFLRRSQPCNLIWSWNIMKSWFHSSRHLWFVNLLQYDAGASAGVRRQRERWPAGPVRRGTIAVRPLGKIVMFLNDFSFFFGGI